jgi:predicted transposase YbfD/YdcC
VRQALGLPGARTPCAAAWFYCFTPLDWRAVARQFQAWSEELHRSLTTQPVDPAPPGRVAHPPHPSAALKPNPATGQPWLGVALDGKRLRASGKLDGEVTHVVGAAFPATGLALFAPGARPRDGELTLAPAVLAEVLQPGRVITADALHVQRRLCRQIRAAGAHYLLQVKDKHLGLRAALRAVFEAASVEPEGFAPTETEHLDWAHGRTEYRYSRLLPLLPGEVSWPGAAQAFVVLRERPTHPGLEPSAGCVYGLTSLPPTDADAATVLALPRGHWGIEKRVHGILDTLWEEDAARTLTGGVAQGMALLRRTALNLLRWVGGRSVAEAVDRVKAHPPLLVPLLGHAAGTSGRVGT